MSPRKLRAVFAARATSWRAGSVSSARRVSSRRWALLATAWLSLDCGGRTLPGDGLGDGEGGASAGTASVAGYGSSEGGGRGGRGGGRAGEGGAGGRTVGGSSSGGFGGSAMAGSAGAFAGSGPSGGAAGSGFGLAGGSFGGFAGDGTAGVAGAAGAAGAAGGPPTEPEPIALTGCDVSVPVEGGIERCENGLLHRPVAGACNNALPRASAFEPGVLAAFEAAASDAGLTPEQIDGLFACREDTDCTEQESGYCSLVSALGWTGSDITQCQYACATDQECGGGTLCECGTPGGRCVTASCFTDSECDDGLHCALEDAPSGCAPQTPLVWTCQTDADECALSDHCPVGEACLIRNGRRQCLPPFCSN